MNKKALFVLSLLPGAAAFQHASTSTPLLARSVTPTSPTKLSLLHESDVSEDNNDLMARRSFFARSLTATLAGASILSSTASFPAISYAAESSTKLEPYEDSDFGFRLQVPSSWENTEQKLSGRRKGIFFTDPNSKDATTDTIETLAFIAYTPLRDDFTSLASFGSVDNVAQTTIMPKGDLAGQDDTGSKMLSAVSKNNAYYFDYVATPVVPTEPGTSSSSGAAVLTKTLKPQHFRTIFTMLSLKGAAGLTLVTITLQTSEERYGDVKSIFDQVIDSYGKIK